MPYSRTKFFTRMRVYAKISIPTNGARHPCFAIEVVTLVTRLSFERTRRVFVGVLVGVFLGLHLPVL